ncbi:hypothetical protein PM082_002157 [Marasmius tenuissimus]|nr:hypothetical protein PM082_002157 [Marasmius tenuissimus]
MPPISTPYPACIVTALFHWQMQTRDGIVFGREGRLVGYKEEYMGKVTKGVSRVSFKFCASEDVARLVFIEKQIAKKTCVVSDGIDVNIVLSADNGVLFP